MIKPTINGLRFLSLSCLALSSSVFAGSMGAMTVADPSHFEIIGAAGIANLRLNDGTLGVTSSETDRLKQTNRNDWDSFTGQVGIGYVYYFSGKQQYSESTQWFPSIEPQVNGYYIAKDTLRGDVWRFGDANLIK